MINRFLKNEMNNGLPDQPIELDKEELLKKEVIKDNIKKEVILIKKEQDNIQEKILDIETEKIEYNLPPLELLDIKVNFNQEEDGKRLVENAQKLQRTLYIFGVDAKVENVSGFDYLREA